jgi:hypothetical protein
LAIDAPAEAGLREYVGEYVFGRGGHRYQASTSVQDALAVSVWDKSLHIAGMAVLVTLSHCCSMTNDDTTAPTTRVIRKPFDAGSLVELVRAVRLCAPPDEGHSDDLVAEPLNELLRR